MAETIIITDEAKKAGEAAFGGIAPPGALSRLFLDFLGHAREKLSKAVNTTALYEEVNHLLDLKGWHHQTFTYTEKAVRRDCVLAFYGAVCNNLGIDNPFFYR